MRDKQPTDDDLVEEITSLYAELRSADADYKEAEVNFDFAKMIDAHKKLGRIQSRMNDLLTQRRELRMSDEQP